MFSVCQRAIRCSLSKTVGVCTSNPLALPLKLTSHCVLKRFSIFSTCCHHHCTSQQKLSSRTVGTQVNDDKVKSALTTAQVNGGRLQINLSTGILRLMNTSREI